MVAGRDGSTTAFQRFATVTPPGRVWRTDQSVTGRDPVLVTVT